MKDSIVLSSAPAVAPAVAGVVLDGRNKSPKLETPVRSLLWVRGSKMLPQLGKRFATAVKAHHASMITLGTILIEARQNKEVRAFGLHNWASIFAGCEFTKGHISNAIRVADSAAACDRLGVARLPERTTRLLAAIANEKDMALADVTAGMILAAKAKAQAAKADAKGKVAAKGGNAKASDAEDCSHREQVKAWKATGITLMDECDSDELQVLLAVIGGLLASVKAHIVDAKTTAKAAGKAGGL